MDTEFQKRRKKSDKAIEKFQRNGGFSTRHVRETERLLEKKMQNSSSSKAEPEKKGKNKEV
jgi:hypothetical protein